MNKLINYVRLCSMLYAINVIFLIQYDLVASSIEYITRRNSNNDENRYNILHR